jgi:hypothetical protein
MDAQLVISDIQEISVTRVHEGGAGAQRFVRVITVRYADQSEYEIRLTANDPARLEVKVEPPP